MLIQWLNHCQDTMLPFFQCERGAAKFNAKWLGLFATLARSFCHDSLPLSLVSLLDSYIPT